MTFLRFPGFFGFRLTSSSLNYSATAPPTGELTLGTGLNPGSSLILSVAPICWLCSTRSRRSGLRGPKNQERLFREFLCYHSHLGRSKSSKSGNPSPIRTFICTLETFFKRYLSSKRAGICPKQTHNIGSRRKVPTAIPIFASRWSKYFEGDEEKKSVH